MKGRNGKKKGNKPTDKKVSSGRVKKDRKDIECWHYVEKGHFRDDCPIQMELIWLSKERKQVQNNEEDKANKAEDVSSDEEKSFMAKHPFTISVTEVMSRY